MAASIAVGKNDIKDELLNQVIMLSNFVLISYGAGQIRALYIGWHIRDLIHFLCIFLLILLTIYRHRFGVRQKAIFILTLYTVGGVSGVFSLGILAGTTTVIPAAAVIFSICYSRRSTYLYILSLMAMYTVIAILFCSKIISFQYDADLLLTSYSHWFPYIINTALFCTVSCVAILNYRERTEVLINEVRQQRDALKATNTQLEQALSDVKTLSGLLPICASCKKIRDDQGYWNQIEAYIENHTDAHFSHGICAECQETLYGDTDWYKRKMQEQKENKDD